MSNGTTRGTAAWLLIVIVIISLLLTLSFAAQNIRYRIQITDLKEQLDDCLGKSDENESSSKIEFKRGFYLAGFINTNK